MKKRYLFPLLLFVLLLIFYAGVYFWVIPKSAYLNEPFRWRSVRAGLSRDAYQNYLGRTKGGDSSDEWIIRSENFTFYLRAAYTDSVATSINVRYDFSNALFHRSGTLYEDK